MTSTTKNINEILKGYTKKTNYDGVTFKINGKKVELKNAKPIDGALLCNHYSGCTGFTYNSNKNGGTITLKRGGSSGGLIGGEEFYRKGGAEGGAHYDILERLNKKVKDEARLQNTISDGCWNCRSIIGWLGGDGCKPGYTGNHSDWLAKCPATCGSYNRRSTGKCIGGSIDDTTCGRRSWKQCGDGEGAKCGGNRRINDINNPECIWVEGGGVCGTRDDGVHGVTRLADKNPTLFTTKKNSGYHNAASWKDLYPNAQGSHFGDWTASAIHDWDKMCVPAKETECGSRISNDKRSHRCAWHNRTPPPVADETSGMSKVRFDALKRDYDTMQEQYDLSDTRLKNFNEVVSQNPIGITEQDFKQYRKEVVEGFLSDAITRPDVATTQFTDVNIGGDSIVTAEELVKQRERLTKLRNDAYNSLTKSNQDTVDSLDNTKVSLTQDKSGLISAEENLKGLLQDKRETIAELNETLRIETENAAALAAHLKDQLNSIILKIAESQEEILAIKTQILQKQTLIPVKYAELEKRGIEYLDLLRDSREIGDAIEALKLDKARADRTNKGLQSTIDLAPKMLEIHKETLRELEAELAEYMLNPETDPIILKKLLQRKKKLMLEVFDERERKYNQNTTRLDRRFVVSAPTDILFRNQKNEFSQNNKKIDTLKKDMTSVFKEIHTKHNEYRKSSYFIFILKQIFIYILLLLLIGLLMKSDNMSLTVGYSSVVVLTIGMIISIILNIYFNQNRNRIYFNKRDWPSPDGKLSSKKCPPKKTETPNE